MEKTSKHNNQPFDYCSLGSNWWVFIIRGCLAFFMPIATVLVTTIIFGGYAILDGIFSMVSGINQAYNHRKWVGLILSGALGIIVGLIVLIAPLTASVYLTEFFWVIIAIWAIITGVFEIASAIRLYNEIKGEWLLAFDGILSIILGSVVLCFFWFNPLVSIVPLGLFIAANLLASGIVLIMLAYKLYRREKNHPRETEEVQFQHNNNKS